VPFSENQIIHPIDIAWISTYEISSMHYKRNTKTNKVREVPTSFQNTNK
jgi:hypothetical protein